MMKLSAVFVVFALRFLSPIEGFVHYHGAFYLSRSFTDSIGPATSTKNDDDLFDPLLSPHSYPNGVDAGAVTGEEVEDPINIEMKNGERTKKSFGFLTHRTEETLDDEEPTIGTTQNADLFDPLLSPHAYPKGTDKGPVAHEDTAQKQSSPPNKKPFGLSLDTPSQKTSSVDPETFDPTISPHAYGKQNEGRVGILLIDHGSKSAAANERLVYVADRYREQFGGIVHIAHMELAAPSIQDGIRALLEENVDEILCQPYFLSPGRHVREDIPELVEEAVAALDVQIPCRITPHVGSVTDGMIQAIHSLVTDKVARE